LLVLTKEKEYLQKIAFAIGVKPRLMKLEVRWMRESGAAAQRCRTL
jgi:hypothetical protein